MAGFDFQALVGRELELRFGADDATPDLHEFGAVRVRVEEAAPEGSPPTPKIKARVLSPRPMEGLSARIGLRYEGETVEQALQGTPITVSVLLEDAEGRAVGGGLAAMVLTRGP